MTTSIWNGSCLRKVGTWELFATEIAMYNFDISGIQGRGKHISFHLLLGLHIGSPSANKERPQLRDFHFNEEVSLANV